MLCSCGHHKQETPPRSYADLQAMYWSGSQQAAAQAHAAIARCGNDLQCQWRFRLLEAEILGASDKARAILSQTLPGDPAFLPLELRRRMLLGFLLWDPRDKNEAQIARRLLDDTYAEAQKSNQPELLAKIEVFEGNVRLRDPEKAEPWFLKAQQHAAAAGDFYYETDALIGLGFISLRRARYAEAIQPLEKAVETARRIGATGKTPAALNNLAICYTQLGDYEKALSIGQEALNAAGNNEGSRIDPLGTIGRIFVQQGQSAKAIDYYRQALVSARKLRNDDKIRTWEDNLAAALCAMADWDAAETANREEISLARSDSDNAYAHQQEACIAAGRGQFAVARRLYNETLRFKVNDPRLRLESYHGLAKVAAVTGNKAQAQTYYKRAIDTIDRTQTELLKTQDKLTLLASLISVYRDYVEFLMQNGQPDQALEIAESSRARILSETVSRSSAPRFNLAQLKLAARRADTVFLSYWLAPAPLRSYLWIITGAGVTPCPLPPAGAIESLVKSASDSIDTWDLAEGENADARHLFDAVLGPALTHIPRNARVVIVPDGALHYVNFETLPAPRPKPHYWIEDATVAIAPSLAIAAGAPLRQAHRYESLLIIGDTVYATKEYPTLQFAKPEMTKVASHFARERTMSLHGRDATRAAYLQCAQNYSVIHFSAHGEANPQSPLESAIILSPEKDGAFKLYAHDVIDLPLHADLVTISACKSAGARVYSGEGLVGFAWAFLKAGAHYVVAGLWNITDRSTPEIMDKFYAGVQSGQNPTDALRAAKLSQIQSRTAFRKPYYWGPFQVYIR